MLKTLVKLVKRFPIRRRTQPPSRKEYRMMLIVLWMHPIIWFTMAYLAFFVWHVSGWYRLLVYLLLAITLPSLQVLTRSYEKYLKKWDELYNPREIRRSGLDAEGMILKKGVVIKKCNPEGKVRIGNELWNAVARDETEIDIGENIIVRDIKDMKLAVETDPALNK
jgi:membrane protein implicated in regulation of membrane protease activity